MYHACSAARTNKRAKETQISTRGVLESRTGKQAEASSGVRKGRKKQGFPCLCPRWEGMDDCLLQQQYLPMQHTKRKIHACLHNIHGTNSECPMARHGMAWFSDIVCPSPSLSFKAYLARRRHWKDTETSSQLKLGYPDEYSIGDIPLCGTVLSAVGKRKKKKQSFE